LFCLFGLDKKKIEGHSETTKPWSSVIRLLQERDSSDPELLIYAVTLINKTLQGLSDQQDSYYDQIEYLEAQGMQQIVSRYVLNDVKAHNCIIYFVC